MISQEDALKKISENLGYTPNIRLLEPWKGVTTRVELECKEHGWYPQVIYSAYRNNCPKCAREVGGKKNKKYTTKEEAVKRISKFLGYTPNIKFPSEWIGNHTRIEIECPIHGWYNTKVRTAYSRGCNKCGIERASKSRVTSKDEINKRIENTFGYLPQIKYPSEITSLLNRIDVKCNTHGWFNSTIIESYRYGCHQCAVERGMKSHGRKYIYLDKMFDSKWEIYVYSYFVDNNINFERERAIKYVTESNNKSHNYYCDFYLTDEDRFVEVKGAQFFTEDGTIDSPWTKGLTEERLSELTEMYNAKHNVAKENGVVYVTSVEHINPSWFKYNEGVQLEDISKYQNWFYKHHTDLDISVWEKDN